MFLVLAFTWPFFAEYDPNPLLSLSKRRRRASTSVSTEERRLSQNVPSPVVPEPKMKELPVVQEIGGADPEAYRERKRLKKRKREKLKKKLLHEERHKKKHKCLEAHCKHRKHHKKHRKHKKRHHSKEVVEEKDSGIAMQVPEEIEEISTETNDTEDFPEYQIIANPEDEVTMDDIIQAGKKVCLVFIYHLFVIYIYNLFVVEV